MPVGGKISTAVSVTVHVELAHVPLHTMPHPLQFALSFVVSAQYGEPASGSQSVCPCGHVDPHFPASHAVSCPHTVPHAPQFELSLDVFAQYGPASPPSGVQIDVGCEHWSAHFPATHF